MVALVRVALMMAVLGIASPAVSHALVPYDNFGGVSIDPDKWSGFESETGGDGEIGRSINAILGSLHMNVTGYGNTSSNSGRSGPSQGLGFRRPNDVTAMQADMTFLEAKAEACSANTLGSRARMQLLGDFFNDGSGDPADGDRTGNYRVGIQMHLDSVQGRQIVAFVNRCGDATCANQPTLSSVTFASTWAPFVRRTLRMDWEPWNSRFVFIVNPGSRQEQHILSYSVEEVLPAVFPFRDLIVSTSGANCTAGRKQAIADGLFDNVMTNPLP